MAIFFHTTFYPDDPIGFGIWRMEHYLEHLQFVQLGLLQNPIVLVPDYSIVDWTDNQRARQDWFDAHQDIHNRLRSWTGVQGVDLSVVDWDKPDEQLSWLDDHGVEHSLIRQALNLPG
jgi:hypothetical protein